MSKEEYVLLLEAELEKPEEEMNTELIQHIISDIIYYSEKCNSF